MPIKVGLNLDSRLTLIYFMARSNYKVFYAFKWGKFFRNYMKIKSATNEQSDTCTYK